MLYVFASYLGNDAQMRSLPGVYRVLNAGGIRRLMLDEELGLLGGPAVQLGDGQAIVLSETVERLGVMESWFLPRTDFGNNVMRAKSVADIERRTAVHHTGLTLDEFLQRYGPTTMADIVLASEIVHHEGWEQYEARWRPGTCPHRDHELHLTYIITTRTLYGPDYERLQQVVEWGAAPKFPERLETPEEPYRYWSALRPYLDQMGRRR